MTPPADGRLLADLVRLTEGVVSAAFPASAVLIADDGAELVDVIALRTK